MSKHFQSRTFVDFFSWFLKQYQESQQQHRTQYLYKIVDRETCRKTGDEKLTIQIVGKNIFLKFTAKELMLDEATLRGFSPLDVRTITYLACKNQTESGQAKKNIKKSRFRICMQAFSKIMKREMMVIEEIGKSGLQSIPVQGISRSKQMIRGFSPEDAHRVGYIAGYEQANIENEALKNN